MTEKNVYRTILIVLTVACGLCAIASEPHRWSEDDAERLSELATQTMAEIGARVPIYDEPGPGSETFDPRALVGGQGGHAQGG